MEEVGLESRHTVAVQRPLEGDRRGLCPGELEIADVEQVRSVGEIDRVEAEEIRVGVVAEESIVVDENVLAAAVVDRICPGAAVDRVVAVRSEERRVGKECRL